MLTYSAYAEDRRINPLCVYILEISYEVLTYSAYVEDRRINPLYVYILEISYEVLAYSDFKEILRTYPFSSADSYRLLRLIFIIRTLYP